MGSFPKNELFLCIVGTKKSDIVFPNITYCDSFAPSFAIVDYVIKVTQEDSLRQNLLKKTRCVVLGLTTYQTYKSFALWPLLFSQIFCKITMIYRIEMARKFGKYGKIWIKNLLRLLLELLHHLLQMKMSLKIWEN